MNAEKSTSTRSVLDAQKRTQLIGLLTLGCSRRKAAQYVGCAPSTITRTALRDPEFGSQVATAEQNIEIIALSNIRAACKQERYWRASAWLLERRDPDNYGPRPAGILTPDRISQLFTEFTEVILREVPRELWSRITDAVDKFVKAQQPDPKDYLACAPETMSPLARPADQSGATPATESPLARRAPTDRLVTGTDAQHWSGSGVRAADNVNAPHTTQSPDTDTQVQHPSNDQCDVTSSHYSPTPNTLRPSKHSAQRKNATHPRGVAQWPDFENPVPIIPPPPLTPEQQAIMDLIEQSPVNRRF